MKATIEFEDELYRQLKATAALRGRKVRELVEDGVRMVLNPSWKPGKPRGRSKLPLLKSTRKKKLDTPDDIAARVELAEDLERYAASLR